MGTALLMFFGVSYGYFEAWALFDVIFSNLTGIGIQVFFLAYVTHHNRGNELNTLAAWVTLWFVAEEITFFFMRVWRHAVLDWLYLGTVVIWASISTFGQDWLNKTQKYAPQID